MAIDPRKLIHLQAIAASGTFGKAAHSLGISQPALSSSMAIFERSLGVRLLERSRRGASLTDFGRLLVDRADLVEAILKRTEDEIRLKKSGHAGMIHIGVSPVASVAFVPAAVAQLKREAPGVVIEISEMLDEIMLDHLQAGRIEVSISPEGLLADPADIVREDLFSDRFVVIASAQNPLAKRRSISLRGLESANWVMPTPESAMFKYIEALFSASNCAWPDNCVTTNSVSAIKAMVSGGDSLSIVSSKIIEAEVKAGMLAAIDLSNLDNRRVICARTRRAIRDQPLVARFLRCLRENSGPAPLARAARKRSPR